MSDELPTPEPLLHQPVRTQIVAFLSGRGEASFAELKRVLAVTDGNLGAHLAKLQEAGFVATRDDASAGNRVQRVFMLTPAGRSALADYVDQLSKLVAYSRGATAPPAPARTRAKPKEA
jgi:DNA-binding MarR family transcriptional regulator